MNKGDINMDKIGLMEGSFEWAILLVKNGAKVTRRGWNKGDYIAMTMKSNNNNINLDIFISYHSLSTMFMDLDWSPNQKDMVTDDWEVVK